MGGKPDGPPALERFGREFVLRVLSSQPAPPTPQRPARPGVTLEGVLTDVLLDGRQDVVAGLDGGPGPSSLVDSCQLSQVIIFPTDRSHAASNQTRGLQLGCKNSRLTIVSHSHPTTESPLPRLFLTMMMVMAVMSVMAMMSVDWTVVSAHGLLHENVLGVGGLGGAGQGVPAGLHAVLTLGAACAAPVHTPATPGEGSLQEGRAWIVVSTVPGLYTGPW